MNAMSLILLVTTLALGAGFLWAFLGWQRTRGEVTLAHERLVHFEGRSEAMADLVKAQAAESARAVADQMVTRATQTFEAQEMAVRARLEAQLKPVADTLKAFDEKVTALEKARAEETGTLKAELAALMVASSSTRDEARKLTEALRGNTGRRGRWGEQTCRNVLEAAGMAGRFDFTEQTSAADETGAQQRPDFIVRMPGGGMFVIDAKVPLALPDPADGDEDAQARAVALRTAASMKTHVRQLSAKAYQDQFKPSPDVVVMFVPGESFLAAALDHEPDLLSQAMASRVLIATPTTLFAICKAVAYGWRAEEQSRNADEVAKLGKELYKRLSVMGGHAVALGKSLGLAVDKYNAFVGSLETQVMVSARRFEDLQVNHEGKDLPLAAPVDAAPRSLARPELLADAAQAEARTPALESSRDR
ncbi:DNA recombination protein RmuC [Brevundimonas aurifodinae]|uniref:DNA recombination protein RmuC homolog n=2 Tax=Brevundimonas TaxID=41275 RepID=A0ABV1NSR2_9CAUL|nr:MAG: recombinase RmuC [Brevundimonas sp. 12-68-7]OYX33869.1 MAG: recombinase RmuC [Brevundimonas subvibrioides]